MVEVTLVFEKAGEVVAKEIFDADVEFKGNATRVVVADELTQKIPLIDRNTVVAPGQAGIQIGDVARPTVTANVVSDSLSIGILVSDDAGGVAAHSRCRIRNAPCSPPQARKVQFAPCHSPPIAIRSLVTNTAVGRFGRASRLAKAARPPALLNSPRISAGARGLGSHVSCCGGPPVSQTRITDLAEPNPGD